MSKIISIGTAVPKYSSDQSTILDFMHAAYNNETASRKLNILFHHSGIKTRYSVVSDFDTKKSENHLFIRNQPIPDVEQRLKIFKKQAILLALEAIQNTLKKLNTTIAELKPTHLIAVTCTGLYAPGIDLEIIEQLELPNDIFHASINFMGCNAAFPALKIADTFAQSDENAKVLIVCVELCTLHFQPKDDNDNLLSNTIFGDGAAAVIVVPDANTEFNKGGMTINGFYSQVLSKGKDLMGWNITPVNFEMILDARVPEFIGNEIGNLILKAGEKLHIKPATIDKWAIHPGGKKILDTIKQQLHLTDIDLQYSYKVLAEYGNMSSPTILFVLNEIMQSEHNLDERVFSIGFGPGLSIETAAFTYINLPVSPSKRNLFSQWAEHEKRNVRIISGVID
jgi:predicted naringenin-chalcone synthase